MKLTIEEFNRIRPLQWHLKNYANRTYNTIVSQTETQLFWLDFMRLIFAPKFKNQYGITEISSFDQTQAVLLTDDLNLVLPVDIETAMYFANNKTLPFNFSLKISKTVVMIVGILLICILIVLNVRYEKKFNFRNII